MPEHTMRLVTETTGWSKPIRTWSLTGPHGPAGSFVVSVSVTPPAATSPGVGV